MKISWQGSQESGFLGLAATQRETAIGHGLLREDVPASPALGGSELSRITWRNAISSCAFHQTGLCHHFFFLGKQLLSDCLQLWLGTRARHSPDCDQQVDGGDSVPLW